MIAETNLKVSSFARDESGELYVADYPTGRIAALVASSEVAPPSVGLDASVGDGGLTTTGTLLSDTGCLDPTSFLKPAISALPTRSFSRLAILPVR